MINFYPKNLVDYLGMCLASFIRKLNLCSFYLQNSGSKFNEFDGRPRWQLQSPIALRVVREERERERREREEDCAVEGQLKAIENVLCGSERNVEKI